MAPDEQTKGGVPGDGGVRTGKKNKQKIPQRGLGVAQLEKLRLEEQQKKASSSSSDPSTQAFGFPPQQQQQPYFPLAATGEGVVRPRVALVLPVSSLPVLSMSPPRPVVQDTSMPVLWNAGDPNASDGEHGTTTTTTIVHGAPFKPNQFAQLRLAVLLARARERKRASEGSGHAHLASTAYPVKQLTPVNSLHLQMELLVSEETLRVPVFVSKAAAKKSAAFSPCVPSALAPTHHQSVDLVMLARMNDPSTVSYPPVQVALRQRRPRGEQKRRMVSISI